MHKTDGGGVLRTDAGREQVGELQGMGKEPCVCGPGWVLVEVT